MNNKFKRIVSLIIVLTMCFSSIQVFAVKDNENSNYSIEVNEYKYFKRLQGKSINELNEMGLSKDEIKELKEFDYAKVLKERAKLTEKELKELGYNDEQINIFQNFTGTEEEIVALSADLDYNFDVFISSRDETRPYSSITLEFDFEWSSSPVWLLSDVIGIAWSDGMKVNMNGTYFTVNYVGGSMPYDWDVPLDVAPGAGITAKWGTKTVYLKLIKIT